MFAIVTLRRGGPRLMEALREWRQHELTALQGHWAEILERLAVARRARSLGELLRDQWDLVPETRLRLARDQRERRELLREWLGRRAA